MNKAQSNEDSKVDKAQSNEDSKVDEEDDEEEWARFQKKLNK